MLVTNAVGLQLQLLIVFGQKLAWVRISRPSAR